MSIFDKKELTVDDFQKVNPEQLDQMKYSGGTWVAYQNQAMDSAGLGHIIFLKVGEDCTHKTPPKHAPDGAYGTGWKYLPIGTVNLETGVVEPLKEEIA